MENDRRRQDRRSARPTLSIRSRVIAFALLAVAPLVFNNVRRQEADRAERIEVAHREVFNLARQGAESQKDVFDAARASLEFLARIYPQYRNEHAACNSFLADALSGLQWAKSFVIADTHGRIFCAGTPASIGLDISDRAHFQRAMQEGGFAVSDYSVGRRLIFPTCSPPMPSPYPKGSPTRCSLP